MYDLFFLSHNEPMADMHWEVLRTAYPHAQRVDGVNGILAGHKACAAQARTSHFFVVDGDNEILNADLRLKLTEYDAGYVHVWRAQNPVNGLVYGWGGIKLFPRKLVLNREDMPLDMTSSFPLKMMSVIGSITHFNTNPYCTWRSAFRECAKLARGVDPESRERLAIWCTVAQGPYSDWCLRGASEGRDYGTSSRDMAEILKINDWDWLRSRFDRLE